MLDSRWADARDLLLVRLDNIGDVVLLSAAIRTVKENLPDSRLTLMASPAGAKAVPLLPWIDDLVVWRAIWQDVGGKMPLDPGREWQLVEELKERQFDAAIIFTSFSQSPHGPAYACYLAGIPLRLGESKEFGGGLLTTELRNLPDGLYQGDRGLRLLEGAGFAISDPRPGVVVPADAASRGCALLSSIGIDPCQPYLVVQPGASCQARRYPLPRFRELATLLERRLAMPVLLSGSDKEAPELEDIASMAGPGVLSIAGRTSVEELAAIVRGAQLVVCNDSLPMHLSAAVGTPSLVLFSGTDLESQWRSPYSPTRLLRRPTVCSPCYRFQCPFALECLDIPPEEVAGEAERLLADLEGTGGR